MLNGKTPGTADKMVTTKGGAGKSDIPGRRAVPQISGIMRGRGHFERRPRSAQPRVRAALLQGQRGISCRNTFFGCETLRLSNSGKNCQLCGVLAYRTAAARMAMELVHWPRAWDRRLPIDHSHPTRDCHGTYEFRDRLFSCPRLDTPPCVMVEIARCHAVAHTGATGKPGIQTLRGRMCL